MKIAPKVSIPSRKVSLALLGAVGLGAILLGSSALRERGPASGDMPPMVAVAVAGTADGLLWVQSREVTVDEWNDCYNAGACHINLRRPAGLDPDVSYPATGISWVDANEYLQWLNDRTGQSFRLPTAAEWFQVAASVLPKIPDPIFTDPALSWASAYLMEEGPSRALMPTGSFSTTRQGVADLDGNVWEWTQDCYAGDGQGTDPSRCPAFVVGGEHEAVISYLVRDPARGGCAVGAPPAHLGLRLVSDLPLPAT